ncbi:MAG TPA: RsiV family protein [Chryseolinea sp.]|nr:RsiV family protein [Chryseolinea sp.]
MKRLLIFSLGSLLLYCCQQKEEAKAPVITYELANFRIESEGGCRADSTRCASYEVSYPVFKDLDSAVVQILTKRIDASVSMGNPEAQGESMQAIGKKFVNDFDDFKKEMPDYGMGWYYEARVEVEVLTDTLLSLSVTEEYFTGGAHGGHGTYFINIKPKTGSEFTLENFFKPDYSEELRRLADRFFRRGHELADTASLQENMFEFPGDRFELNQNYGFTPEGLMFYYNSYEIAAYAAGPSAVLIPYDSLKPLMKK